ncbi:tetratricopeptide repeat protein [Acidobacteriota bacterium]
MLMKKFMTILFFVFVCFAVIQVFPCTIFNAAKNGIVLAAGNEDMISTDTKVWFIPGKDGKYGVVYVGFENYGKQAAMNDQGLFFDGNALKYAKMKPKPEKLPFPKDRDLVMMIMEECATVEDVVELMSKYNLEGLNNGQGHFADKTGAAAVIGPDKNGDMFVVRKKGIFQVSTNFSLANPEFGGYNYPCPRYNIATEMLESMEDLTVERFRAILSAVHSEGSSPTVYSTICDLTDGDIYIYNFHNFEEEVKFHLEDELSKGEQTYTITELFSRKTNAQIRFEESQEKQLSTVLLKAIDDKGIKSAIKEFHKSKEEYSKIPGQLGMLTFLLSIRGQMDDALAICKLCAKEFPTLPSAHKALGDLYSQTGDKKQAIKSYKKTLKLNPENTEVGALIEELKGE